MKILISLCALVFFISAKADTKSFKDFEGCYTAVTVDGKKVTPASFPSKISIQEKSVLYKSVDGKNIPALLIEAAVKGPNFEYFRVVEQLLDSEGMSIDKNTVYANYYGEVLGITGAKVTVDQQIAMGESSGGLVDIMYMNESGQPISLSLKHRPCQ